MSSKGGSVKVSPEDMDEAARVSVGIDKDDLSTNVELKKKTKQEMVSAPMLFRYATESDMILFYVGFFFSAVSGAIMPMMNIVFGDMINAAGSPTSEEISDAMNDAVIKLLFLAAAATVSFSASFICTMSAASRNVSRIRNEYMRAVMGQGMSWFDTNTPASVTQHLDDVATDVYFGTSAKLVEGIQGAVGFVAGFAVAFYFSWQMTVVLLGGVPLLGLATYLLMEAAGNEDAFKGKEAYQRAGSIASEVLSAIRTVAAMQGEVAAAKRYKGNLKTAERAAIKQGLKTGFAWGMTWAIMFALYGGGFWFGGYLIVWSTNDAIEKYPPPDGLLNTTANGSLAGYGQWGPYVDVLNIYCADETGDALSVCACAMPWSEFALAELDCGCSHGSDEFGESPTCYTGGDITLVFFSVLIGGFLLGQVGPSIQKFQKARAAAYSIFKTIDSANARRDRETEKDGKRGRIDVTDNNASGAIAFEGVHFKYESRENPLFSGVDVVIEAGKTTALVGESGAGKSTIGRLLLRLYDPVKGRITLDGVPIETFDVKSLRSKIGVVSQEPLLFDGSIADNIRFGIGDEETTVTMEKIREAAKMANCHDFIMSLPHKYETTVGVGGGKLSGGQKQRISIARALIRNPQIMILDEATSALDSESERTVQMALDALMETGSKRTIVVIAHRLSTIRNADKIVVLGSPDGTSSVRGSQVLEVGTHDELVKKKDGVYRALAGDFEEKRRAASTASLGEDVAATKEVDESSLVHQPMSPFKLDVSPTAASSTGSGGDVSVKIESLEIDMPDTDVEDTSFCSKLTSCCRKKDANAKKKKDAEESYAVSAKRVWAYSAPEWPYLAVGLGSAICNGLIWPSIAIAFSKILTVFYEYDTEEIESEVTFWGIVFLVVGVAAFVVNVGQSFGFAVVAERLTTRLRVDLFRAMLRQNIGWFDEPANGVGGLSSMLSTDTNLIHYTTGSALGGQLYTLVNVCAGFGLAIYASWKFTFGLLGVMPLFMVAGAMEIIMFTNSEGKVRGTMNPVLSFVNESIAAIREVKAFAMERRIIESVRSQLIGIDSQMYKQAIVQGLTQGMIQCVQLCFYAFAFWYGSKLLEDGDIDFERMNLALWGLAFAATGCGTAASFFGDQGKANAAKSRIFQLIDRAPTIDSRPWDDNGDALAPVPPSPQGDRCEGRIALDAVKFAYPTRPSAAIFNGISLKMEAGKSYAFVGSSGSGKSSVVSLLERFYDPTVPGEASSPSPSSKKVEDDDVVSGKEGARVATVDTGAVLLDGSALPSFDVKWFRRRFGLVGQEPKLFQTSFYENIAMGKEGASREEIVRAAKAAHAHDFIMGTENGYDTDVGVAGSRISGGQKQRVAIARAIINMPDVLLLDEATSALDNESEKIVQSSIDKILSESSCTSVIIAHRLTTIRNVDRIFVFENKGDGAVVVESGTHSELMGLKGKYRALYDAYAHKDSH
eukprot:g1093.t1